LLDLKPTAFPPTDRDETRPRPGDGLEAVGTEVIEIVLAEHFQGSLFGGQERFCPLPVVYISLQDVPAEDATFSIPQRQSAGGEPAVDAVGSALAVLALVRCPVSTDRLHAATRLGRSSG
jgi:hypothetical protein